MKIRIIRLDRVHNEGHWRCGNGKDNLKNFWSLIIDQGNLEWRKDMDRVLS